jgi:hypothetical protein
VALVDRPGAAVAVAAVAAGPTRVVRATGPVVAAAAPHKDVSEGELHTDTGWALATGAPANNAAAGAVTTIPFPLLFSCANHVLGLWMFCVLAGRGRGGGLAG